MKTILNKTLLITGLLLTTFVYDSFSVFKIDAKLTIGRKSRDCRGFGVCTAIIIISLESSTLHLSDDGRTLIIDFPYAAIKGNETYFGGSTLDFEEEYIFPGDIQSALGSKNQLVIRPGKYKLEKTPEGFTAYITQ